MKSVLLSLTIAAVLLAVATGTSIRAAEASTPKPTRTLNVLFIGNSFTARHNLAKVVKSMAEAADPSLKFEITSVIYGGRTLADHWRFGTMNFVNLYKLTAEEEAATLASLKAMVEKDPNDKYAKSALARHQGFQPEVGKPHPKWDVIVLQSYRDDVTGEKSRYVEYAPRYAEAAHAQGARVILYETTPSTQNAEPLKEAPDPKPVMEKEHVIAALANRIDAHVAPMALIALKCQTERPDLTLRYVNDAHLNQTMSYMSACAIYAAIFDKSPVGLPINSVTDTRYFEDKDRTRDADGGPITRTFSDKDRAQLQTFVWNGIQQFKELRKEAK